MVRRVIPSVLLALIAAVMLGVPVLLSAQWLKYPTPNVPRTADGKINMSAPTPRTPDGKPDFSGLWFTDDTPPCPKSLSDFIECGIELPIARYGLNIATAVKGGLPLQPWAAALVKKRTADQSKDDPHARCMPDMFLRLYGLPHYMKILQVPGLLVELSEANAVYRQVFTDNRPLPDDPTPNWQGFSSATWDGDTLVVNSIGFRDDQWLDMAGNFISEQAKIRERIRRPDYGHLLIDVTVDDPKVYTRPWDISLKQRIVVGTELVDEYCIENEKSSQRFK
jgi:hypothetical protein